MMEEERRTVKKRELEYYTKNAMKKIFEIVPFNEP